VLRGGSKQAAFATDVSPKALIMAGLTCGNPIFNNLFEDKSNSSERGRTVIVNVNALKEIATDYKDRICTPVYIGIRTGFIQNEDEVRNLESVTEIDGIKFVVTTPIDAARQMSQALDDDMNSQQPTTNEKQNENIEPAS
jgi:CRISPR-associated protein Cst2